MLDAPIEIIRPNNTETPLKASVSAPGRWGEGKRDGDGPDEDLEDAARRHGSVLVEAVHRDDAAFDAIEEECRDPSLYNRNRHGGKSA
jgi:hypothetical protein